MKREARILVVDDKESFRFLIREYLESAGYRVMTAAGVAEALTELERTGVDLVISDLVMPEMDGMTLLRRVRSRLPRLPFVLVTAHGSVTDAVTAIQEGADNYLLKPLSRYELLREVARLLGNS